MAQEEVIYVDENNRRISPPLPSASAPSYPPLSNKTDKADLLEKIRPDLAVEVMRHKLMGEIEVNGRWHKHPALTEGAISEQGAWDLSNLSLVASSQNTSLSNLTDDEIRARTAGIVDCAIDMMLKRWKEYGIKGTEQIKFIVNIIQTNTFITLKQAQNRGIIDLLKGTTQESRIVSQQDNPSIISRMFGRKS